MNHWRGFPLLYRSKSLPADPINRSSRMFSPWWVIKRTQREPWETLHQPQPGLCHRHLRLQKYKGPREQSWAQRMGVRWAGKIRDYEGLRKTSSASSEEKMRLCLWGHFVITETEYKFRGLSLLPTFRTMNSNQIEAFLIFINRAKGYKGNFLLYFPLYLLTHSTVI